jgi:hypothetical protein
MKPVYVATDYHDKQLQRALLQYNRPQNAPLVREALRKVGREDLIGYSEECLVRPENGRPAENRTNGDKKNNFGRQAGVKKSAKRGDNTRYI